MVDSAFGRGLLIKLWKFGGFVLDSEIKRRSYLSRKQLAFVNELFDGELDENKCLVKHKVGMAVYRRWLGTEVFSSEIAFRIDAARRQSVLIIAKYAPVAATKLVTLTDSEKEETARKACLDIIQMPNTAPNGVDPIEQSENELNLPVDTARKILSALADKKREEK